ncbi:MAG: glycosyltransferase family 39 protein [Candidatus Levybacteria bacterium]|nr:glycosyltransferase family 39 protein [Candidatus Levybacteria bacterium]
MSKKVVFIFLAVLLVASVFRLYELIDIPPGVNRDEASIGYTAYSILHTGKDEYGKLFPLSFQSFGDWKLPLYIYTVVPFVSVFGLSELAVRLPSAIIGILSVALTFYLVKILFKNNLLALIAMFLAAVSSWSVHLSRVESESNTAVFLTLLGTILFLKSFKEKKWLIIPSAFCFALTYFTYAGNHIFTTFFVAGLVFFYRDQIKQTRLNLIAFFIFLSLSGLIFYQTLFSASTTKLSGISIFGDPSVIHAKIEIPRNEHTDSQSLFARITHNKIVFAGERIAQNYLNSFSPSFLFIKGGDNNAHNIANFGNMYIVEAPFLFLGLIYLLAIRKGREKKLLMLWFFIAPIAVSITKDAPHTNRMFAIFPALQLVTAFGIWWTISELIKKDAFKKIFIAVVAFLFLINVAVYIDRYFIHFPRNEVRNWGLGYKKLDEVLSKPEFVNKKIIISRPKYSPYIYLLFYNPYDPSKYQKEVKRYPPTQDGFVDVKGFGRYEFRGIDWGKDIQTPNTLIVDWSSDVPASVKQAFHKEDIILPNDEFMFTIIETR